MEEESLQNDQTWLHRVTTSRSENNDGDACKENEPNLFEIKDKLVEIQIDIIHP